MADISNYQPLYPDDQMADPTTLEDALLVIDDLKDDMARLGNVVMSLHKKEAEIRRVLQEVTNASRTFDEALNTDLKAYIDFWPVDSVSIPYFPEFESGS